MSEGDATTAPGDAAMAAIAAMAPMSASTGDDVVDIRSDVFARRLARVLAERRRQRGTSIRALARQSRHAFTARELRAFEEARGVVDEARLGSVMALYGAELEEILPGRTILSIRPTGLLATSGLTAPFTPDDTTSLLVSYLQLVRQLRAQQRSPALELRREDVEVIAEYTGESGATVIDRLGALMGATITQRRAMTGMFLTGAIVIGLAGGSVAAVSVGGDRHGGGGPTPTGRAAATALDDAQRAAKPADGSTGRAPGGTAPSAPHGSPATATPTTSSTSATTPTTPATTPAAPSATTATAATAGSRRAPSGTTDATRPAPSAAAPAGSTTATARSRTSGTSGTSGAADAVDDPEGPGDDGEDDGRGGGGGGGSGQPDDGAVGGVGGFDESVPTEASPIPAVPPTSGRAGDADPGDPGSDSGGDPDVDPGVEPGWTGGGTADGGGEADDPTGEGGDGDGGEGDGDGGDGDGDGGDDDGEGGDDDGEGGDDDGEGGDDEDGGGEGGDDGVEVGAPPVPAPVLPVSSPLVPGARVAAEDARPSASGLVASWRVVEGAPGAGAGPGGAAIAVGSTRLVARDVSFTAGRIEMEAALVSGPGFAVHVRTQLDERDRIDGGWSVEVDAGWDHGALVVRRWQHGREARPVAVAEAPGGDLCGRHVLAVELAGARLHARWDGTDLTVDLDAALAQLGDSWRHARDGDALVVRTWGSSVVHVTRTVIG